MGNNGLNVNRHFSKRQSDPTHTPEKWRSSTPLRMKHLSNENRPNMLLADAKELRPKTPCALNKSMEKYLNMNYLPSLVGQRRSSDDFDVSYSNSPPLKDEFKVELALPSIKEKTNKIQMLHQNRKNIRFAAERYRNKKDLKKSFTRRTAATQFPTKILHKLM